MVTRLAKISFWHDIRSQPCEFDVKMLGYGDSDYVTFSRDYRGLKKHITAIRRAHLAQAAANKEDDGPALSPLGRSSTNHGSEHERPSSRRSARTASTSSRLGSLPPLFDSDATPAPDVKTGEETEDRTEYSNGLPEGSEEANSPSPILHASASEPVASPRMRGRSATVTSMIGRAFSTHIPQRANSQRGSAGIEQAGPRFDLRHPIPLMELLPQLSPVERAYFDKLDEELEKIDSFYCEREREMRHRLTAPTQSSYVATTSHA